MADESRNRQSGAPEAAGVPPKIRLNLGQPANGRKPDTSRIDLSAAEPPEPSASGGEPLSVRQVLGEGPQTAVRLPAAGPGKSETSRISIHDSRPVKPGEQVPVAKAATSRIPLSESQALGAGGADVPKAMPKPATSKIAEGIVEPGAAEAAAQGSPGRTARIIIDESETELPTGGSLGDTGKMVVPPEVVGPKPPPKTVRLARPTAAPKTVVLKRPDAVAEPAPKTVVLKRPEALAPAAAQPVVSPPTRGPHTVEVSKAGGSGSVLEAKGTTARISIPESAVDTSTPPTQRKTIRIKRPDAGGAPVSSARTVVLQRPAIKLAPTPEGAPEGLAPSQELAEALGAAEERGPGVGFAIVAALTFLVLGGLLYALLAQTYFPDWPMPGRVI